MAISHRVKKNTKIGAKKKETKARGNTIIDRYARKLVRDVYYSCNSVEKTITPEGRYTVDPLCPTKYQQAVIDRAKYITSTRRRNWSLFMVFFVVNDEGQEVVTRNEVFEGITSEDFDSLAKEFYIKYSTEIARENEGTSVTGWAWVAKPDLITCEEWLAAEDDIIATFTDAFDMFNLDQKFINVGNTSDTEAILCD